MQSASSSTPTRARYPCLFVPLECGELGPPARAGRVRRNAPRRGEQSPRKRAGLVLGHDHEEAGRVFLRQQGRLVGAAHREAHPQGPRHREAATSRAAPGLLAVFYNLKVVLLFAGYVVLVVVFLRAL